MMNSVLSTRPISRRAAANSCWRGQDANLRSNWLGALTLGEDVSSGHPLSSRLNISVFRTTIAQAKSGGYRPRVRRGSSGTTRCHLRPGLHGRSVLRTADCRAHRLRRARWLRGARHLQGNRIGSQGQPARAQPRPRARTGPPDRRRSGHRAVPVGAVHAGPSRDALQACRLEGVRGRHERHDVRARHAARTDDGHDAGRNRPVRK